MYGGKGTLLHCWWECKLVQPLGKTVQRFLKTLKKQLPYYPEITFLGLYPDKTVIWKDRCIPMFSVALFPVAKTYKQPKCPWTNKMWYIHTMEYSVQFSSVAQSCPTLCDRMYCSTPGFPVLHYLQSVLRFMSTESVMLSNYLILCCPLLLPLVFPSFRVFSNELAFAAIGRSIGASALASVLPMNIQGWFLLGLTCLISLLSKGSQVSSPAPQIKSINSSVLRLYGPILTSVHDYEKSHNFDYMDLCWQSDIFAF